MTKAQLLYKLMDDSLNNPVYARRLLRDSKYVYDLGLSNSKIEAVDNILADIIESLSDSDK